MIKHLEESTNTVKAKNKYIKIVEIFSYIFIWGICVAVMYLTRYDYTAVLNSIIYFVLPLSILAVSTLIGRSWGKEKMLMPFLIGGLYRLSMLLEFCFVPCENKYDFWFFLFNTASPLLVWGIALSYLRILFGSRIFNKKGIDN